MDTENNFQFLTANCRSRSSFSIQCDSYFPVAIPTFARSVITFIYASLSLINLLSIFPMHFAIDVWIPLVIFNGSESWTKISSYF